MPKKGKLFLLTGPSGSGKTTIAHLLLKYNPTLERVTTYTTRLPRKGEINGIHYHFIDRKTFKEFVKKGAFLEWARVYGNYYGQKENDIELIKKQGKNILLVIDPQGMKTLMEQNKAISFFLDTESDELLFKHLCKRSTDKQTTLQTRLKKAKSDRKLASFATYQIQNIEGYPEKTAKQIEKIIQKELTIPR